MYLRIRARNHWRPRAAAAVVAPFLLRVANAIGLICVVCAAAAFLIICYHIAERFFGNG